MRIHTQFFELQFFFLNDFHGNFCARFLVSSIFNKTILSFTKIILEIIEVMEAGIADCLFDR